MVKRKYITFKVEDDLPGVTSLPEQGRAQEPLNVRCGRCMRFCGFCCVCTSTLFQALAPWMLSVIEVVSLLLLYVLLVLPYRPPGRYSFEFRASTEDVVLLGGMRAATLAATYAWGSTRQHLRPYLYSSYVCGAVCLLYVCLKAWLYSYPLAWLPPAALMTTSAAFSCLDVLAARYTVHWYRRRGQLGLLHSPDLGPSSNRRRASAGSPEGVQPSWLDPEGGDVPPELLADHDSRFLDVDGLRVHYKEAWPAAHRPLLSAGDAAASSPPCQQSAPHHPAAGTSAADTHQQQQPSTAPSASPGASAGGTGGGPQGAGGAAGALASGEGAPCCGMPAGVAVVLLHGFAGGEFAWRHLLQPLSDAVGVRVLALDRPGFGLTIASPDTDAGVVARGLQPPQLHSPSSTITQPLLPTHHQHHSLPGPSATHNGQAPSGRGRRSHQHYHQQLRPLVGSWAADPYSLAGQARMVLRFCQLLGITRVLLVAHADGCAVAAHAAAAGAAASAAAGHSKQQEEAHPMQQQQQVQGHMPGPSSSSVSGSNSSSWTSGGQDQLGQRQGQRQGQGPQSAAAGRSSEGSGRGRGPAGSGQPQDSHACVVMPGRSRQAGAEEEHLGCVVPAAVLVPPLPLPPCSAATSSTGEASKQQLGTIPLYTPRTSGSSAADCGVKVVGLALLHPNLMGHQLPAGVTRLLAASGLGRSVLRSLLRSEVGLLIHRRAWARPDLATDEVVSLYQRPLRVEGWEQRLLAACSATAGGSLRQLAAQLEAVQQLPALLVTGDSDAVATPGRLAGIAAVLRHVQCAVVPNCGHLSHEEAPQQLLELLVPFTRQQLASTAYATQP